MSKIVPLSFAAHGRKTLLPPRGSYRFAAKKVLVPLTLGEFAVSGHRFPIVFSRFQDSIGTYALLGLAPDENLFVDATGRWQGDYVPAQLRHYPFFLGKTGDGEQKFVLCVDEDSAFLADAGGAPLFDKKGGYSPGLQKLIAAINEYQKAALITEQFCNLLAEKNLFVPFDLKIDKGKGAEVNLGGLLRVAEEKLNGLDPREFVELRDKGWLPLIYMHFFSLNHVQKLLDRKKALDKDGKKDRNDTSGNVLGDMFQF